jgi:CheY-like chemotaxis protein
LDRFPKLQRKPTLTYEFSSSEFERLAEDKKVLIVDDDGFILFTMKKLLIKIGLGVVDTAKTGSEAVSLVLEENKSKDSCYSLILMDINMPVMNGYEAARRINEEIECGGIEDVGILAVTAQDSEDHYQKANQTGIRQTSITHYITYNSYSFIHFIYLVKKPITQQLLKNAIYSILTHQ